MAYATAQYDFAGSVAVVTGGASGVGAEVARQLQVSSAIAIRFSCSLALWERVGVRACGV
ncbi:hypothetical protein [Polaromonas sp. JS666]|uniref:hypothetical protein n=1 Tax=Polaromonas sp. (strain JS666 / ATCC BAA-500) TaxID=296591 RepID=UPI0002E2402F|nr:hypothetical protein [Polaromonas sp. JS666]